MCSIEFARDDGEQVEDEITSTGRLNSKHNVCDSQISFISDVVDLPFKDNSNSVHREGFLMKQGKEAIVRRAWTLPVSRLVL